jgi:hypothetical protein
VLLKFFAKSHKKSPQSHQDKKFIKERPQRVADEMKVNQAAKSRALVPL